MQHFFLQALPYVPHLRSLSIPFLADHVHGTNLDPRELALQIVDIVALRPEVELCYMGIANKCFEILENRKGAVDGWGAVVDASHPDSHGHDVDDGVESDDVDEVDEDDEDGVDADAEDGEDETVSSEGSDSEDDVSESGWSDEGGVAGGKGKLKLRLREILFYDDKVAVFKARHGRL